MKFGAFLTTLILSVFGFHAANADVVVGGAAVVPAIWSQPLSQTTGFGTDVTFTAGVTADSPTYQWFKNGAPLADYNNIAGSSSAMLHVVGAALDDAGSYSLIVTSAAGLSSTSTVATLSINQKLVFADDFESGLANWKAGYDSVMLNWDTNVNHTPGGTSSALASGKPSRMHHSLAKKLHGRLQLSFWMYDDGVSKMAVGEVCGYSGENGYGRYAIHDGFGLIQSLGIGYRSFTGTNVEARAEQLDATKYQAHVLRGPGHGWFNLSAPGAPTRSRGWHKFEIRRSKDEHIIDFYVDGVLGRRIREARSADLDTIIVGSWGALGQGDGSGATGVCSFDDIALEAYPATFDYESSAQSGPVPTIMQLRETGTNGAVSGVTAVTAVELAGSAAQAIAGKWEAISTGMLATDVRGQLAYSITVPSDDVYRIEIEGREESGRMPEVDLPLNVSMDGEYLGHFNLEYHRQTSGRVHCFTPFIRAGVHNVVIEWDNARPRRALYLTAVRLQSLPSSVVANNGIKQWVVNRLSAECGLEVIPRASKVSPVCIEGRARYHKNMTVLAGEQYPLAPVTAHHGTGYRWYANVPLSATNVTAVEVSYQSGVVSETNTIVWEPTDVLTEADMQIRKGDSLIFNAVPAGVSNGTFRISINSQSINADALSVVPYRFSQPGTYTVTGTYLNSGASRSINVHVIDASLPRIVAVVGWRAHWYCTNLPPEVVIDSDPRILLGTPQGIRPKRVIQKTAAPAAPQGENARDFNIRNASTEEPRYVVARLGTNGPIMASATIQGIKFAIPPETQLRVMDRKEDGTQLIEGTYLVNPMLPTLTVGFRIATAGVTFDDGTVQKLLTPTDFDGLGLCRLRFVRSTGVQGSVCHDMQVYENGVLINHK